MKKDQHEKEPNHERYLLSYADFITLLMIFFILLYSMSNLDSAKYKNLAESLGIAMGSGSSFIELNKENAGSGTVEEQNSGLKQGASETDRMEDVKNELDMYLKENGLGNSVETSINERGLIISLNDTTFFDSGRAIIIPESKTRLVEIGKILNKLDNFIRVEGHTDNVPISNSEFKSNWELSAIRATNVTELLIDEAKILPSRISAVGYGEYRPIDSNKTEKGRARNRRVDIVILSSKFNNTEEKK